MVSGRDRRNLEAQAVETEFEGMGMKIAGTLMSAFPVLAVLTVLMTGAPIRILGD